MYSENCLLVFSNTHNTYKNLAIEKLLLQKSNALLTLFLWQSENAVVIGANQNPYQECNLELMQSEGVILSRRITGGGAVYHDLGNLNYCFICDNSVYNEKDQSQFIIDLLSNFSIVANLTGRNDLTVEGGKISGCAYYKGNKRSLRHGTLLINSNVEKLNSYLTPNEQKLQKKGVQSVKSRVRNLTEINSSLTVDQILFAFTRLFFQKFSSAKRVEVNQLLSESDILREMTFLSSKEWLYSKWENRTLKFSKYFEWGMCSFDLDVSNNGVINDVLFQTDAMNYDLPQTLRSVLLGANIKELSYLDKNSEINSIINDVIKYIKESTI